MEPIDNDRWERLVPLLEPGFGEVERLLRVVEPVARLRAVTPQRSGLANTNLRLELEGGGTRLLRLHQREALGSGRCAQARAWVEARAASMPALDGTLCHGDFKGSNLLLRIEGERVEVAALLDWEFAFAGHPLFDLAALLRYRHLLPPGFVDGVEAGYREGGGGLEPGWEGTVRLMDMANLIPMAVRAGAGSAARADLLELVDRTLALPGTGAGQVCD